jgi:hypothetical protein
MELNAGNGIVGVRLGELVMTPLGFKGLDIRSRPLTFQAATAFTNSANRTVINSTVASTSQLSGCQLLLGRSLRTGGSPSRWGFYSLALAQMRSRHL